MTAIKKSVRYGAHDLVLETGEIARQASGAVLASLGRHHGAGHRGWQPPFGSQSRFFPVDRRLSRKDLCRRQNSRRFFQARGRPAEKETLTCRLIDRPLRPSFPKGFRQEVQVIATVMSLDPEIDPDIPALIGASAAVSLSGMPFSGPIGRGAGRLYRWRVCAESHIDANQ